ncbi:MAG: transglycosylase SLT domain-containing protein [Acidobacteriota bacterium]|nr:transglycosylase SLT domain-containing protein [Acidobacteriota bacterium]
MIRDVAVALLCLAVLIVLLVFISVVPGQAQNISSEHKEIFCEEVDRAAAWDRSDRLAARTWVESNFRTDAVSPVGAAGWSQFMPLTWQEESARTDPSCSGVPATDPACSARAQIRYTRMLRRMVAVRSLTIQDLKAKQDIAYNGGIGNLWKEERACARRSGCDSRRWWGHVEGVCLRHPAACRENRAYPVKINRVLRNPQRMARLPRCEQ